MNPTATCKMIPLLGALAIATMSNATTHGPAADDAQIARRSSEGEIRRIDVDAKKLTIRHGPLENLAMPAMTMVFQVDNVGVLTELRVGDRIKFIASRDGGAYVAQQIERVK